MQVVSGFSARILLDSVSPAGARLTTMEWVYPRFIHSEVMTYRMFSRNSSSSRALPIMKMVKQVVKNPAGPVYWGRKQRGMQARRELDNWRRWLCVQLWYLARWPAVAAVLLMYWLGLHKQVANRLLEPWYWIKVVITASPVAWENCFRQRCHPDAQPEFQEVARLARSAYEASIPVERLVHLPFVQQPDDLSYPPLDFVRASVARCARTSYETHTGEVNWARDVGLYEDLRAADPPHTSPFEHAATAHEDPNYRSGNFFGWVQHREEVDPYFIHWSEVAS